MDDNEGSLIIADSAIEETESFLLYDKSHDEVTNVTQDAITLQLEEDSQGEIQDILNSCGDSSQEGTIDATPSTITFYGSSTTEDNINAVHDEEDQVKYEQEEQDVITISEDTTTSDTFQPASRRSSTIESSITSEVDSEEEENSLESDGGSPIDEVAVGTFKCRYCPKQFTVRQQATRHVITEHEVKKTRNCRFCFLKFRYRRQRLEHELTTHRRSLTAEDLAQYPSCSSCGKEFVKHASVRHHIQQVHLGKGEVIDNRSELRKAAHNAIPKAPPEIPGNCSSNNTPQSQSDSLASGIVKCRFCNHRSKTAVDVLVHELRMHKNELPSEEVSRYLTCVDCGKLYRSRMALSHHKRCCKGSKSSTTSKDKPSSTMQTRKMTAALEATTVEQPPVPTLPTGILHQIPSKTLLACGNCGIVLPSDQLVLHMTQQCPMSAIVRTVAPVQTPTPVPTFSRVIQKYRCADCDGEFFHEEAYERHRRRRHPQIVMDTVDAPPIKIETDFATSEDFKYTDAFETSEQYDNYETAEHDDNYETTEQLETDPVNSHYYEQETPELNHQEDLTKFHPKIDWFGTQKSDSGIKCPICPKMLNSLQALALHEEWHDADELDRCKYCDQVYPPSCRWYMETHVLENHPEKLKNQAKAPASVAKRKQSISGDGSDDEYYPSDGQREFYCRKCDKQLSQQVSYDIHMFRLHPESFDRANRTIYVCDICREEFLYPSQLRQHKERQHQDSGSTGSKAKSNNQLLSPEDSSYTPDLADSPEMAEEVGEDQQKPEGPQRNLNQKILIGPETIQDNKCPVCHNTYSAKWFTESHVFKQHPEQFDRSRWTVYTCRVCRDEYIHKHLFRKHLREHGLDPDSEGFSTNGKWPRKSLKNKAGEVIPTYAVGINDKVMVSRIKDAKCPVCSKQYACNWSAEEHAFRNHRGQFDTTDWNMFVCRVCQEEYLHNHLFRKHLRSHGIDPDKEGFPSSYAPPGGSQTGSSSMVIPKDVEKPSDLTCHVCFKKYSVKWAVDDHVFRLHPEHFDRTEWTIYSCDMCAEEFIYKHKYRDHLRRIHNSDPDQAPAGTSHTRRSIDPVEDSKSQSSIEPEVTEEVAASISSLPEASEVEENPTISLAETAEVSTGPCNRPPNPDLTCPVCSVNYSVRWSVDEHIFKKHPEIFDRTGWNIYTCPVCNEELIFKHLFRAHLRRNHKWGPDQIDNATAICGTKMTDSGPSIVPSEDSKSSFMEASEDGQIVTASSQVISNFSGLVGPNTVQNRQCPACLTTFYNKINTDEHIFKKHPELIDRIAWNVQTCRICSAEFIHNCHFRTHLKDHGLDPDKEGAPVSQHFRKRFFNDEEAPKPKPKRKRRRRYGSDDSDTDDDSDEEFRIAGHRGRSSTTGSLKCSFCDITFTQNHARHQHTFRFHRDLADWSSWIIYKCYDCPEEYVYKSQLRQHCKQKSHKGWFGDGEDSITANPGIRAFQRGTQENNMGSVGPYSVDVRMDSSSAEFRMEVPEFETINVKQEAIIPQTYAASSSSTSKKVACQHCPATYTQNWCLRVHMFRDHREHVDLTSVRIHRCADCGIEFIYKSQLNTHCKAKQHTPAPEEEPLDHRCNTCEISFPTFASFSQHYMENHVDPLSAVDGDDGVSFGCRFCNLRYESAEERNQHEEEVHPDLVEILGPCQS